MIDYSFLRFIDNFDKAKDLQNSKLSEFNYDNQIHLKPDEIYSFITNVPNQISFNNNVKAYLVDCENNILVDISTQVYIEEFTHNETGLKQCKIELVSLNVDYITDLVFLRLDHDILNGKSYWSNPFIISEYDIDETIRADFKHYQNLDGTCYEVAENFYQSIRLKAIVGKKTFSSSSQSYTDLDGNKLSSRLIKTPFREFIMDMNNDFIYERIQYLLSHDILYINGIRVTDKQTFENDDRYSHTTNVSQNKYKVAVNENDTFEYTYQIFEPLALINKIPSGPISIVNYLANTANGTQYKLSFNKVITLETNIVCRMYYGLNTLLAEFDFSLMSVSGNDVLIDTSAVDTSIANSYHLKIDSGKIKSGSEEFVGFTGKQWSFAFVAPDYKNVDYNNPDYNT